MTTTTLTPVTTPTTTPTTRTGSTGSWRGHGGRGRGGWPLTILLLLGSLTVLVPLYVTVTMAFSSYLMAMAPVILVYVLAQRWVMSGLTQGAVK